MEQTRWKRPWLAAILGVLATGLGHLYLRRLQRALGWVLVAVVTTFLFVSTSTVETITGVLMSGSELSLTGDMFLDLLPLFAVGMVSALDAYLIAYADNRLQMEQQLGIQRCPECGKPIDPDVSFCQWCATPRDEQGDTESKSTEQ
jgi:hypothetical protein